MRARRRALPARGGLARSRRYGALAAMVLAGLLGLLAGCDGRDGDTVQAAGGAREIAFGIAQRPLNLDPRLATDATSERLNRLLYARLVELDDASRPVPGIARWQRLSPTRYRFVLGERGRRFSDGRRLAAGDVAATYRSVLDPASASPHRAPLALIERIEVLGDEVLEFHLAHADRLFPAYLGLGILPADGITAGRDFQRRPLGSGPFRLTAWPGPGRLVLERRSDGQRIAFVTVRDPNVRVMKLLRGELDLIQNDLPPELIGLLERRAGIRVRTRPGINYSYLGLNLEDRALADRRVRRAIAHAIDRATIVRGLLQGRARLAEALLPPEHWAATDALAAYEHDPARAAALLAAAGHGSEAPLRLSLKTSSDPFRLRLATVLQAQLAEAGMAVAVESYDWGTFFGDVKAGRFQLYGLTWVGIRLPDIFRYAFHSDSRPPEGANRGRYRSPVADRLIEAAAAEPDPQRQAALYRQLQHLLHRELPVIPLWYEHQVVALRADLAGYPLAADGNYDGVRTLRRRPPPRAETPAAGAPP